MSSPSRSLSLSCYLLPILASQGWSLGWCFGGFGVLFFIATSPLCMGAFTLEALLSPFTLFSLAFIFAGLTSLYLSTRDAMHSLALMHDGASTDGVLVELIDSGVRVNKRTVWWGTYFFTTAKGVRYLCMGRINRPTLWLLMHDEYFCPSSTYGGLGSWLVLRGFAWPRGRKFSRNEESPNIPEGKTPVTSPVFYCPYDPTDALPLTAVPGNFRVTESGEIRPGQTFITGLISPALVTSVLYFTFHPGSFIHLMNLFH